MKNEFKTIKLARINECNFGDVIEYNNCIDQDIINNQSDRLFNRFSTFPTNLTININNNDSNNLNINVGNEKVKIVKNNTSKKHIGNSNNKFRKK